MGDDYKYNWDEMIRRFFPINEHRINNTGWMMKWWWNGGVERKQSCWENAERFLIYIFLHQKLKQCLEFALTKLIEICKYLAGACNSNSHARGLHYLTFVCKNKAGKSTQWGELSQKMYWKELSIITRMECEEVSLQIEFYYIAAKKPQPLCENWNEKGMGEKR